MKAIELLELKGYTMIEQLAKGHYGIIMAADSRNHQKNVAIKICDSIVGPSASVKSTAEVGVSGTAAGKGVTIPSIVIGNVPLKEKSTVGRHISDEVCEKLIKC